MRTARSIVAGLLAMLIGSTAWAAACDGFTDVDSANSTYCSAVTYLKDKGITLGCTGTTYCPNDFVTRLQMALFLQRIGKADPSNTLGGHTDTIGGGIGNSATGGESTISGGASNAATGLYAVVIGGGDNTASGNVSTVLGGQFNVASGYTALAAGTFAKADQSFCAVFNFWIDGDAMGCLGASGIVRIGATHGFSVEFASQAAGGGGNKYVYIGDLNSGAMIAASSGATLSEAGVWTNVSDRAKKHHFTPIDTADILARVAALPIDRWQYKVESDTTHIGPVAQDFYAEFNVGADDRTITTIDEGGVALAAIQGLNAKLEALVAQQARELAHESNELAEIKAQLAAMAIAH